MNTFFEKTLTYHSVYFRYARGKSIAKGNEIHPYHELLFYMDGDAVFLSETCREILSPNTLLFIPKERYHNFRIQNQDRYTRLVLNFPDLPDFEEALRPAMRDIRILHSPDPYLLQLLQKMCETLARDVQDSATPVFLYGAFLSVFAMLCKSNNDSLRFSLPHSTLLANCTAFIDKHFTEPISVGDIASAVNASPSTLFHCFKTSLGISVHRYITEKRLIYARNLLKSGKNPTEIFSACGFGDYSSFYKAYRNMFAHSPAEDKNRA